MGLTEPSSHFEKIEPQGTKGPLGYCDTKEMPVMLQDLMVERDHSDMGNKKPV